MPDFCLPDLGEGLTEAELVTWRVRVGDEVAVDQIVAEVETAKAMVEVPVPFAGTVTTLHAEPGQSVTVGAPLISVGAAASAGFREPGVVTAPVAAVAESGSGNVLIGYGTSATPAAGSGRRRRARARSKSVPSTARVGVISPLVRKLAHDASLDLTTLHGTGPAGLILRRDVENALAQQNQPATPTPTHSVTEDVQRIPLRGVRKAVADKLSRSRREIPEATVWVDVDATELLAARAVLNARRPEQPVSVLALLARFTILGLRRYPELNGRVEGDEIVLPSAVHLGFAAQTDRGLVVPVMRDAHALSTRDLSGALAELTSTARNGSLEPTQLTGGTFTVNNYGVFGVDGSAAIINHPEVAILGIGRIIDRPWAVAGQLAVRKVSQLTLAFDHRVCDGGTAGGFLRFVADCVESPISALGDL